MATTILTNVPSLNAQRNLASSSNTLGISLQRLSSGLRINSAKDDAAGLAISERMTSQINGLDQAGRNANDGISMAQTGEGALATAGDMLQRIRELAVQSVNATNSVSDRAALQNEVSQLSSELDRIASTTAFNGQLLLNGSNSATYQVGANANETITATTTNFRTDFYGNYRIGAVAATATSTTGDLTIGSTSNAIGSNAAAASRVVADSVIINGALGTTTIQIAAGASAKTVAKAINDKTSTTDVTASAKTVFDLTNFTANTSYSLNFTSNNASAVAVSFTAGAALNSDGLAGAVNAINDATAKTGVTAMANSAGTGITLTNAAGENITLSINSGTGGLTVGGTATASSASAIGTGQLTLDSDKSFNVVDAVATDFFNVAGSQGSQLQKTSQVDVSNVDAANRTISIIDGALQSINGQRAKYGALQSRFDSTVSNLKVTSENLSAARSRIRDTDFAAETANLTRNQILVQAGTAMLAQANSLPSSVLTLLK
jgi:flagellin